ncbi:MAG: hypothetical protein OEL58_00710 [Desulfobacteraceae bacterium]|nr:hypothetical protein [Desulfobacteraceae bacterium]
MRYLQGIKGGRYPEKVLNNRFALDTDKNRGAVMENAVVVCYCFGGVALLRLARSEGRPERFCHFPWWPEDIGRAKLHQNPGGIFDYERFIGYSDYH